MRMIMINEEDLTSLKRDITEIRHSLNTLLKSRDNKLYNVSEAAKQLHITPQTLHSYIRAGYVKPLIINGRNKFTQEIISSLITKKSQQ